MAQTRKSTKKASAKTKSSTAKKTSTVKAGPTASASAAAQQGNQNASGTRPDQIAPKPAVVEHPDLVLARGLAEIIASYDLDELVYDTGELTLSLKRASMRTVAAPAPAPDIPSMPMTAPMPMPMPALAPVSDAARSQFAVSQTSPFANLTPEPAATPSYRERSHQETPEGDYHIITSPFVGTFYRRPSPDADVYVTLGSRVAKGQVMCIIEAMKLMNEIESDAGGTVADILVEDAQSVEYGQALFKILIA
jgi:acetyl-CoA carboxylase biotin carboxyl carrier protein